MLYLLLEQLYPLLQFDLVLPLCLQLLLYLFMLSLKLPLFLLLVDEVMVYLTESLIHLHASLFPLS